MSKTKESSSRAVEMIDKKQPLAVMDIGDDAGAGFEGAGAVDYAIPFLTILQSGSPQCKRSEGAYIEGASEGMLFNTVTEELLDVGKTPLTVVPCYYRRSLVEWRVRENGGGFVREHEPAPGLLENTIRDEKNRDIMPNGNQINDTRSFYVLIVDEENGVFSPAVITMTSTQIKKARQWMMQQNMLKVRTPDGRVVTPAMFASAWHVTTVPESNEKGSWMGWRFDHAGYHEGGRTNPLYKSAKELHEMVKSGEARADMTRAVDPEGAVQPGTSVDEEDAPEY